MLRSRVLYHVRREALAEEDHIFRKTRGRMPASPGLQVQCLNAACRGRKTRPTVSANPMLFVGWRWHGRCDLPRATAASPDASLQKGETTWRWHCLHQSLRAPRSTPARTVGRAVRAAPARTPRAEGFAGSAGLRSARGASEGRSAFSWWTGLASRRC